MGRRELWWCQLKTITSVAQHDKVEKADSTKRTSAYKCTSQNISDVLSKELQGIKERMKYMNITVEKNRNKTFVNSVVNS